MSAVSYSGNQVNVDLSTRVKKDAIGDFDIEN